MTSTAEHYKNLLEEKGLKVTPQRISVLQAVHTLRNHPTADMITEYIKTFYPNIATGTVYKVLDVLVEKDLLKRVKTDKDIMRYDGVLESHHHLYCSDTERIEDYIDDDLDGLLRDYFSKRKISNFQIEEIKLQINGKFKTPES